jgi:hypothetical protein
VTDKTADRLIDLGTAALGVACLVVGVVVPAAGPVLLPVGGGLVGGAMKRPSDMLKDRRAKQGPVPVEPK